MEKRVLGTILIVFLRFEQEKKEEEKEDKKEEEEIAPRDVGQNLIANLSIQIKNELILIQISLFNLF